MRQEFLKLADLLGIFLPAYNISAQQIGILLNELNELAAQNLTTTYSSVNIRKSTRHLKYARFFYCIFNPITVFRPADWDTLLEQYELIAGGSSIIAQQIEQQIDVFQNISDSDNLTFLENGTIASRVFVIF